MPQRFLRPGIRTSSAWNQVSFPAQGLYISLLTLVDDWGRYDGRAALIHGECFSLRSDIKPQRTAALLEELNNAGLIQLYQCEEGKDYLQICKWQERSRGLKSKFPDPPQDSAGFRIVPQEKDASLAFAIATTSSPSFKRQTACELRYPADAGDEFKGLFERWIEFRKGLGKKPKDWAALFQEQLDWIAKQPREDREEIVSQSIRNAWQGLFALKKQHPPGTNGSNGRESVWALEKRISETEAKIKEVKAAAGSRVFSETEGRRILTDHAKATVAELEGNIRQWRATITAAR